jgi:hypothetical protein
MYPEFISPVASAPQIDQMRSPSTVLGEATVCLPSEVRSNIASPQAPAQSPILPFRLGNNTAELASGTLGLNVHQIAFEFNAHLTKQFWGFHSRAH